MLQQSCPSPRASEPAPLPLIHHNRQRHLPQRPSSPEASAAAAAAGALVRDYRKGNWTLHETLILITAKRLDDERRAGDSSDSAAHYSPSSLGIGAFNPRSAEQRWKWVENYCWRNGCLRSQNQCNDKWDNLLRDYKKVRDYEARVTSAAASAFAAGECTGNGEEEVDSERKPERPPYWSMERHERKEWSLPTNMAAEVYEALTHVLSRRAARRGHSTTPVSYHPPPPVPRSPPRLPLPPAPTANLIPPTAPELPPTSPQARQLSISG